MNRKLAFVALAAGLAGCAYAAGPKYTTALGPTQVVSGGTYNSGGGITVAMDLREVQGRTLVCGVWAQSDQQSILTLRKAYNVVASGSVTLDGRTILRGLSFMEEVPPMADYTGQEAGCRLLDRPWQAGDETREAGIRIPRQVVHVEGGGDGGGFEVTFRQTGPGAGGV